MKSAAVIVFQALVATYAAAVVGVGFTLGPYALAPAGLTLGLLGLLYALLPGALGLIAAYFWIRGLRGGAWLKAVSCVLWGALAGFLWISLLLATDRNYRFDFRTFADLLPMHVVPGAVGGLIFWLLARKRVERYSEAMAHDSHS